MNTLDFVRIERYARKLHDEEVRRLFGNLARTVSQALGHFLHGLHPARQQGAPKRYA